MSWCSSLRSPHPAKLCGLSLRPRLADPTLMPFPYFKPPLPIEVPHQPPPDSILSSSSLPRPCHPVPFCSTAVSLPEVPRTQRAARSPGGDSLQLATCLLLLAALPPFPSDLNVGTSGWTAEPKVVLGVPFLTVLLWHPVSDSARQQKPATPHRLSLPPSLGCKSLPQLPRPFKERPRILFQSCRWKGLHPRSVAVPMCAASSWLLLSPGLR